MVSKIKSVELSTKQKGNIGQLAVALDLAKRGHTVAFPTGEFGDWDLLVERTPSCTCREYNQKHPNPGGPVMGCSECPPERAERVQVKYTESDGEVVKVRPRTHSTSTRMYTSDDVDWIAVYDSTSDSCYYVRAGSLGEGKSILHLRIEPAKNNQNTDVRWAHEYTNI